MEDLLIGSDPVGSDVVLRGGQIHLATTHLPMQLVFELIFNMGVPGVRDVRLRPQIFDAIGAAKLQTDQVVYLILAGAMMIDAILLVNLPLHLNGHISYLTR